MEESCYLLQLYSDNVHVMRSDFSVQGCTSLTKQMAWETIATKLQQAFPAGKRTVKECQKRWHTILTSSRPKLAKVNGDFTATVCAWVRTRMKPAAGMDWQRQGLRMAPPLSCYLQMTPLFKQPQALPPESRSILSSMLKHST
ncbi:hypothetical protein Pcinc_004950 [Petrolisthes cinctipes]|uniref:Regulatory protein zeste n=1 Tax=Petrolisthes cinctipes TaxID=88211 RepID=A0AAE1GFW7_PETCI|nr:hypothetical protein Pcinc_004950 [Petrolisthes cinctipes]